MRPVLTERQNQIFEFVRAYQGENGRPPTIAEIGRALAIRSTNGVFKQLQALEAKGYLRREPHAARGLRIVDEEAPPQISPQPGSVIPIVSRTKSDAPELLRRRPLGTMTVDPRLLDGRDTSRFIVGIAEDEAMRPDGIHKGDFLTIEEQPEMSLKSGALIAVLLGDALVARIFARKAGRVHLQPADSSYAEEVFGPDAADFYVIGCVRSIMRKL
ncbi:S24 family peptidase [soil metagenome]